MPELFGPNHDLPAFGLSETQTDAFELPVYRLNAPKHHTARHMWTTDPEERSALLDEGWRDENVVGYATATDAASNTVPIYRLYQKKTKQHLWTASTEEKSREIQKGWDDEHIAFYAIKNSEVEDFPDWMEDFYLSSIGGRRSQLTNAEKADLIQKCCPIWITSEDEDYQPMDWLSYRGHCVEDWLFDDKEGVVDIEPKHNTDFYSKDGKHNPNRFTKNLLHKKGKFASADTSIPLMNPQAAPTLAFYQEQASGVIWIRYFLFFGYNLMPLVGWVDGNHFADWVHIVVELESDNNTFVPKRYFFSQHSGGTKFDADDHDLDYYSIAGNEPTIDFSEYNFRQAGPWNIGVFCAYGTHECYANSGVQGGRDHTSYGAAIVPFLPAEELSQQERAPLVAWDMTNVSKSNDLPKFENARFVEWVPETILPTSDDTGFYNFTRVFCKDLNGPVPVRNCGRHDSKLEEEQNVTSPAIKIFEWGTNFEN